MTDLSRVPAGEHFAILTEESVTTPGDERSRTNPGHGYGESTSTYMVYEAFTNEAEWIARIKQYSVGRFGGRDFRAIRVKPAKIDLDVKVS